MLNLRTFFLWTGVALIFIAAGPLAHAVHEFVEVGWITIGTSTAFDISAILPHEAADGGLGSSARSCGRCSATRARRSGSRSPSGSPIVVVLYLYTRPRPSERRAGESRSRTPPGA